MKTSYKFALVAIPLAVAAFLLGRILWPDVPGAMMPTAGQLPFFIFLSALESLAFGIGVAFLLFGWAALQRSGRTDVFTRLALIATAWLIASWWPHDNMHRVNGLDMAGLLKIEYTFHFTLILSGFIVAAYLWRELKHAQRTF